MKSSKQQVFRSQCGASLVEYCLLVSLVAFVCVTSLTYLGTMIESKYTEIALKLDGSVGTTGSNGRHSRGSGGGTEIISRVGGR